MIVRDSFLLTGIIILILFSIGCIENDHVPTTITETPSPAITSTILPTTTPKTPIPTPTLTQTSPPHIIFDRIQETPTMKSISFKFNYSSNGIPISFSFNVTNTGGSGNVEIRVWDVGDRIYSNLTKTFYVLEGGKYNIIVYIKPSGFKVFSSSVYINSTNAEETVNVLSSQAKMINGNWKYVEWWDFTDIEISLLSAP